MSSLPQEATDYLAIHPETEVIDLLVPDPTGILRGKRLPIEDLKKLYGAGVPYPGAGSVLDAKGEVVDTVTYGTSDGDPDIILKPVPGTLVPVPYAKRPTAQVMMQMEHTDGRPYMMDTREVLRRAAQPLYDMGLTPVIAIEYEFYLLEEGLPVRPAKPQSNVPELVGPHCFSFDAFYDHEDFLQQVEAVCKAQRVRTSTALTEFGQGQFELNLPHQADIFRACDDAFYLKRAVKGVARQHSKMATFMAKPFAEDSGSGLHIHVSVLDKNGNNIFGDTDKPWSDKLEHAAGGLHATMAEAMAIFAPVANSYRRFRIGTYVPVTENWGPNHRAVAVRIPLSDQTNKRLEHRVAGADANPYLVTACVLAGIHHGLKNTCKPGTFVHEGEILERERATLPIRWSESLKAFKAGTILKPYLGESFHQVFYDVRRCEEERFHSEISDRDMDWYLRSI